MAACLNKLGSLDTRANASLSVTPWGRRGVCRTLREEVKPRERFEDVRGGLGILSSGIDGCS